MMLPKRLLAGLGILLLALVAWPAAAQVPTRAAIDAACKPGADPQIAGDEAYPGGLSPSSGGLTPQHLPGATTVSVREAKCMIDRFPGNVLVLAAINDGTKLPGAIVGSDFADADASLQAEYVEKLARTTEGNKALPIIVYCHHERCFLSYNLALRTVQAGYVNVFWMRPGLTGWKNAGYPVEAPPPAPGEVEVSTSMRDELTKCRKTYLEYKASDWASMLTQLPTEAEQQKAFIRDRDEKARWYKMCLDNRAHAAKGAADKAEATKAAAAANAEVATLFNAARHEVETNPAKYLSMTWDSHQPAKLRADLAALNGVKTLEQACGTFDFSQPPIGGNEASNRYIKGLNERRKQHGDCIIAYRDDSHSIGKTFGITSANIWVHATRRFTCAVAKVPNCIPSEPYNTIAGIATDANAAFVKRQDQLASDQRQRVGDLIEQGNSWIDEVNRRIGEYNARH